MVLDLMPPSNFAESSAFPNGKRTISPPPLLWPVQLFRGVAAAMVVSGHTQSAIGRIAVQQGRIFDRATFLPWGAGVDLFFIISGFIMVHASTKLFGKPKARGIFLARRLARIVPLYWLFTAIYIAVLALAAEKGGAPVPSISAITFSLLFMPFHQADGSIFPVFSLGWTLNYEFGFYLLFSMAVGWRSSRALGAVLAVLITAACAGLLFSSGPAPLVFFTRPIVLEFGLGLSVGFLHLKGFSLPPIVRGLLIAIGMGLFVADLEGLFSVPLGATVDAGLPRVISAGLPATVVLAGAVLGPQIKLPRLLLLPTAIGDASYSLYLIHAFVLIVVEKLVAKSAALAGLPLGVLVIATLLVAASAALASFRWIERPLTAAAGGLLSFRRAPPSSLPITASCL